MSLIIRQVLVIFSDGLDEDVMTLERESELLRQSGKTDRCFKLSRLLCLLLHKYIEMIRSCKSIFSILECTMVAANKVENLCRCQRSVDCGSGWNPRPFPAADGGVWSRVWLQGPAQHRHAKHRKYDPQTDCKSLDPLTSAGVKF